MSEQNNDMGDKFLKYPHGWCETCPPERQSRQWDHGISYYKCTDCGRVSNDPDRRFLNWLQRYLLIGYPRPDRMSEAGWRGYKRGRRWHMRNSLYLNIRYWRKLRK